ncbi:MAG: DUF4124 domain-containing protein [Pseudomonadota bacterium]
MAVSAKTGLSMACALFVLVTSLPVAAQTTYYRWQDDKGNMVHSDRPPASGVPYEVITSGSNLVRKVDADEGAVPATTEPTVSNDFEPVESKAKPVQKNAEQCQRARDNLETLNTKVRIQIRNDQGELRPISEEEKDIQRQKALDAISVHC